MQQKCTANAYALYICMCWQVSKSWPTYYTGLYTTVSVIIH